MQFIRRLIILGYYLHAIVNSFVEASLLECLPPFIPMNGSFLGKRQKYTLTEEIQYQCDKGFHLVGDKKRECQMDRNWSGSMPFCDPISVLRTPVVHTNSGFTEIYVLTDNKEDTCFPLKTPSKPELTLHLKAKVKVSAIRIHLPKGNYNFEISVYNETACLQTFKETLTQKMWMTFGSTDCVTTDKIFIRDKNPPGKLAQICEVQAYAYEDLLCNEPPNNFYLPNIQLMISRKRAMFICNGKTKKTGLYFVCENGKWIGVGKDNCKEDDHGHKGHDITIYAAVIAGCLALGLCIIVAVYIYKKRQRPVVRMQAKKNHYENSAMSNCSTASDGAIYTAIKYEEIPLPPAKRSGNSQKNVSSLPDILSEYDKPADDAEISKDTNYIFPQDALSHISSAHIHLKDSPFYGD